MVFQFIKSKFLHILILVLMIAYVLAANTLFVTFFLRHGKPIARDFTPPPETNNFEYDFGPLESIRYDGENVFVIRGYALHQTMLPGSYHVKVLMHSTSQNLLFETDRTATPSVLRRRKDYYNGMRPAEFQAMISMNVLDVNNYRIGLVIEDEHGAVQGFIMTEAYVERSPNALRFIYGE
jgi:hypothetical protein